MTAEDKKLLEKAQAMLDAFEAYMKQPEGCRRCPKWSCDGCPKANE